MTGYPYGGKPIRAKNRTFAGAEILPKRYAAHGTGQQVIRMHGPSA